jgi:hypothetical protein
MTFARFCDLPDRICCDVIYRDATPLPLRRMLALCALPLVLLMVSFEGLAAVTTLECQHPTRVFRRQRRNFSKCFQL